jgi:hypothetical protein
VYTLADVFAVVTWLMVALTVTDPAACAGVATVHSVLELQFTEVALLVPNLNAVAVVPGANPVPLTVTVVPPAVVPELGLKPVIVGTNL